MEGLGLNIWEILLHVLNIFILFIVLRIFLYKPISKFMNKRSEAISKQIDEAAAKQSDAQKSKAQYDEMIKNAQSLAGELIEKSKVAADKQANVIIADARKQAEEIISRSQIDIDNMKIQAKEDMRGQIVEMAVDIAEKVLRREISVEDNMKTIDQFFEERVTE